MVQTCGAADGGETGAQICICGGNGFDHHQSWLRHRAWAGYCGTGFADGFDGAGALYRFDAVECGGDEGDGTQAAGWRTFRMRIIVAPDKFKDCLSAP